MSITSTNLNSDTVYQFDDATTPLWAVCYAYCADNDQLHELFVSAHNNTFLEFSKTLPVTVGQCSIACGDWAAPTSTTNVHPRPHTASVPEEAS